MNYRTDFTLPFSGQRIFPDLSWTGAPFSFAPSSGRPDVAVLVHDATRWYRVHFDWATGWL